MGLLTDGVVSGGGAVHVRPHPVHGLRLAHVHDAAAQARGVTRPPVPNLDRWWSGLVPFEDTWVLIGNFETWKIVLMVSYKSFFCWQNLPIAYCVEVSSLYSS